MGAQGYKPHTILAKDNESKIRMLVNGKASCTSNSKHVAIKYFWCTDRIKKGKISVRHCPTDKMLADYMSKPLQGKLFTLLEMCSWDGNTSPLCLTSSFQWRSVFKVTVV